MGCFSSGYDDDGCFVVDEEDEDPEAVDLDLEWDFGVLVNATIAMVAAVRRGRDDDIMKALLITQNYQLRTH